MTLLLIRHGETEWKAVRRYQGQLDSPLTERGIGQASAIARRLVEIICARRRCTAFETDDRLREITRGSWDGFSATRLPHPRRCYSANGPHEWYFHSADGERYKGSRRVSHRFCAMPSQSRH